MLKGLCRGFAFMLAGGYTALLIKKPDASYLWTYLPVLMGLGFCAWYGWEKD